MEAAKRCIYHIADVIFSSAVIVFLSNYRFFRIPFLSLFTFKSHFYLVNTVVFCKYLHFMFLVNFTIALASYYVIWLSLVSDYGIFWGVRRLLSFISLL